LGASTSKVFEAIASDRESPIVDDWTVESPAMNTRAALVVRFPEVLDRSLLSSAIDVVDGVGAPVPGAIDVLPGERTWRFVPDDAWQKGAYRLRVSSELEDVAGNSLRRVFDTEMAPRPSSIDEMSSVVTRPFSIGASSPEN
jgi:hypothetical protein